MANEAAYELKEQYIEGFAGGSCALPDGSTLDVAALLDEGNGFIVTSDPQKVQALDGFEALKRTQLGEAKQAIGQTDGLDKLKTVELEDLAEENEVDLGDASTNAERIAVLREAGVTAEGSE